MRFKIAAIAISALIAAPPVFAQTQTPPPSQPPSTQQPQTQQPQTPPSQTQQPQTQQPQQPRTHQQPSNPGQDQSTQPSSTNKDNMPRTASSTTLIGLIGIVAFGSGIALSAIRRRRAFRV